MFRVQCCGDPSAVAELNVSGFGCGVQTIDYPALSDNLEEIKESLDYVVTSWNKRPEHSFLY